MGMDVFGNNPRNKEGEYFRNNVWWWRPLADFILECYPEIANKCEHWHSNDGDGLDAHDAKELAKRLQADIENGKVSEWEKNYNEWRSSLPREACEICNCTGIRSDKRGIEMGMPDKELSPENKILTGREYGWCNSCDGVGTKENWLSSYPFETDNVKEFANFLKNSGGFKIC